jgi:hypothetical protein
MDDHTVSVVWLAAWRGQSGRRAGPARRPSIGTLPKKHPATERWVRNRIADRY